MKDYFVYLPKNPEKSIWGCVATAAGFTNVLPNNLRYLFKVRIGMSLRQY